MDLWKKMTKVMTIMTPNEFKSKWDSIKIIKGEMALQRVNNVHPLDFYVGYNQLGSKEFVLFTNIEPKILLQCDSISIESRLRQDNKYAVCFTLLKQDQSSVFMHLCWDLFEFSKVANSEEQGIKLVESRFKIWQKLMRQGSDGLLPVSVIRGLIGELIFLKDFSFPKYGFKKALDGWVGVEASDRDFVYDDFWYEIKAIDPSASSVHISSIEQLDIDNIGQLVTVIICKTSIIDSEGISLPKLVDSIRTAIRNDSNALLVFEKKMMSVGYIDKKEYYNYCVDFTGFNHYTVDEMFPKIRRINVDVAIIELSYSISLAGIAGWLI